MKLIQLGYNLSELKLKNIKLIQVGYNLSEFSCKLIGLCQNGNHPICVGGKKIYRNWYNLDTKIELSESSYRLMGLRQKKFMKLIQLGYKSSKIFDLSEFLFKVYEIDTIWMQKFENFCLLRILIKVYKIDIIWIQNFENF